MSTEAPKPKYPKFKKVKFTDQDVRAQALEARDEILANVEFLIEAIREDRYKLQRYKDKFGDMKYRPIIKAGNPILSIETEYGPPTEVNLEPLASTYRATINSLLQSIRLIQSEILPEDNPEGETSSKPEKEHEMTTARRQSLRDSFATAAQSEGPPEPTEDDEFPTELVEKPQAPAKAPSKPKVQTKLTTEPKANPTTPKPWREKPQSAFIPKAPAVVVETEDEKPVSEQTPKNLTTEAPLDEASSKLRDGLMQLKSGTNSRMAALAKKYGKK